MKYLGVDYGTRRTGIAISDSDGRIAVVKETIKEEGMQNVIDRIKTIVSADAVEIVVVGMPVSMNGEYNEMAEAVERFVERLRDHVSVPVQTVDERLTTEMAKKLLQGANTEDKDQVAAQILLQNVLDQQQA